MSRAEIIDQLWLGAEPLIFLPKEEFTRNLTGWVIEQVVLDGAVAFVTMTNGPAFHCHSFQLGQRIPLKMLRDFVQNIIDLHGYATTSTPKTDVRQHRFNKVFGFEAIGEDAFDIHYRIDRIGHARSGKA